MRCKELQAVLEGKGLGPLPLDAQEHLAECPECQDFVGDLSAIVAAARQLPAEVNPPDRVWISLRAQLAAEGIIREETPVELPTHRWWQDVSQFFQPRLLASVGAGLLVVLTSAYFAKRPDSTPPDRPSSPQTSEATRNVAPPPAEATAPPGKPEPVVTVVHRPHANAPAQPREAPKLKPSPSEIAFLGETAGVFDQAESDLRGRATSNAMADASLRANLKTLDGFIAECQARLAQNPQDQLTREYLNVAYQQKAELLSAMMDSGRSEH